MNEVKDFHPLVAGWLHDNGYRFKHEYKMPDFGRVDFYAVKNKAKLLVECKTEKLRVKRGIMQLAAYGLQVPEAQLLLAIPRGFIGSKGRALAERYEVQVLEIEVSDIEADLEIRLEYPEPSKYELNETVAQVQDWHDFFSYLNLYPEIDAKRRILRSIFMISLHTTNQAYCDQLFKAMSGEVNKADDF